MHARALAGICRLTEELAKPTSIDQRVQAALGVAIEALGADHGSVRVCEGNAVLRPIARSGVGCDRPAVDFREGQGLIGWAVKTQQAVRVSDTHGDARFHAIEAAAFDVRSLMSIPMMAAERVVGVFSVSAAEPGAFDAWHELAAVSMAHCIGQALRLAELERQATTDAMTRTLNRSQLLPTLRSEINRAQRDDKPLSVLLIDLDHFKSVNDRYGHAVGDAVLSEFADMVRKSVRSFDILIRRGGEEFELVMPATSHAEGLGVAERVRHCMASEVLRFAGGIELLQTVSIGLATWDGQEEARSLDHRADLAMYAAKRQGRNRVVSASGPLPATGATAPELYLPRLVQVG